MGVNRRATAGPIQPSKQLVINAPPRLYPEDEIKLKAAVLAVQKVLADTEPRHVTGMRLSFGANNVTAAVERAAESSYSVTISYQETDMKKDAPVREIPKDDLKDVKGAGIGTSPSNPPPKP